MAVKAGAPRPDISSVAALKATLLRARTVGYSSSASGVYLTTELFPAPRYSRAMEGKLRISEGAVGPLVASGEAEIGFQQISELLPVLGIDYVGPLPAGAQRETIFAAGIVSGAPSPDAARALVKFFQSADALPIIRRTGSIRPYGEHSGSSSYLSLASGLRLRRELALVELRVKTRRRRELRVRAALDDAAFRITRIRSARKTVDSRCAITIAVRPASARSSAACTAASEFESRCAVASSSTTRSGAFSSNRAIASRCFSPPEKR